MLKEQGITPAYAGSTFSTNLKFSLSKDHPRLRGEYLDAGSTVSTAEGSPPLARGVLPAQLVFPAFHRITPAYAGSTLQQPVTLQLAEDQPRLRREYKFITILNSHF